MDLTAKIKSLLDKTKVSYEYFESADAANDSELASKLEISPEQIIRATRLKDDRGKVKVVLPINHMLDLSALSAKTGRELEPDIYADNKQELETALTFSGNSNTPMFVSKHISQLEYVYIISGTGAFKLKANDYLNAFDNIQLLDFSCQLECVYAANKEKSSVTTPKNFSKIRMRQRLEETFDLPAMPQVAQEIMKLRVDPSADSEDLAAIVNKDPSLAAQVISWASSPYYGYQGTIDSIETAITRVLGFDLVMNLALGIAIGKSLQLSDNGPLGLEAFWRQSVYCASLSERLCYKMKVSHRPQRGLVYLSGLLHNFGHLILGHIFPPQFKLINQYVQVNPGISVEDLENHILGVSHGELGAWLMEQWHMPEELIVAVHWHHKEEFWSKHGVYSNIVFIANNLLKRIHIGDAINTNLPDETLNRLGLTVEDALAALEIIADNSKDLDMMSSRLVAA